MTILDEERDEVYMYQSNGGQDTLGPDYLDTREPIYECHDGCSCDQECPNRVVERGRKVMLQIFRTDDGRGWGMFP